MAHSTSWGRPKARATSADRATSPTRSDGGSEGPSLASKSSTLPCVSSRYREPSTSPLTSGSGPPRTADTTRRSLRPLTGSTPNMTPPNRGSMSGWTSTAIGESVAPARSRESRTASTAAVNSSSPLMPMTDSNWPAIDEAAVSSTTDELRATRAWRSPSARSKASFTAG